MNSSSHKTNHPKGQGVDSDSFDSGLGLLEKHQWLVFVLPLVVYMALQWIEPLPLEPTGGTPATAKGEQTPDDASALNIEQKTWRLDYRWYPMVYSLRIALTIGVMLFLLPGYLKFPLRVSWLSIAVGIAGVVIWIGLCQLRLEERLLVPLGLGPILGLGQRVSFNPLEALQGSPIWLASFLAIRFIGLAAVVPVIEEFFLRGFLMRLVMNPDWWKVPIGTITISGAIAGTLYGMLTHPAELMAAAAWFSLITWLMVKTRNIWDCVAAHAVTNLLLGIYVIVFSQWHLW